MMWIFFIDWQQYWKCDWTMNIGANRNAANEQYQQNSQTPGAVCKTGTSERLDIWASRVWRGIELVFKSLDCFFSTRPITRIKFLFFFIFFLFNLILFFIFFFFGGGGAQLQCIYYLVLYTDLKAAEGN